MLAAVRNVYGADDADETTDTEEIEDVRADDIAEGDRAERDNGEPDDGFGKTEAGGDGGDADDEIAGGREQEGEGSDEEREVLHVGIRLARHWR